MRKEGYYSSGQFAALANVSVRTIRFYDRQNLLKPSYVNENGARFYTDPDLVHIQQILLLKYLGFSLEDIRELTIGDSDPSFLLNSLHLQRRLVDDRIEQLSLVREAISDTASVIEQGKQVDWRGMLDLIHLTGMENTLASQYRNATNISARIRLHSLYSTNKAGWFPWLFSLADIRPGMRILEIGCGPGALAEALKRRYPNAEITAIDRDKNFISFARVHVPGVTFLEGDATKLPFMDGMFDVTISYTVSEHVDPSAFFGEQHRVRKPGGFCLCLSARKSIECPAPCVGPTAEEIAFWDSIPEEDGDFERLQVCRYPMTEAELPIYMEKNGFRCVSTGFAVIDLTPDAPKYDANMAEGMIEACRQNDLEAIASAHSDHGSAAIAAVNRKYDERLRLYRAGEKQWDTSVSVTMIVRGIK